LWPSATASNNASTASTRRDPSVFPRVVIVTLWSDNQAHAHAFLPQLIPVAEVQPHLLLRAHATNFIARFHASVSAALEQRPCKVEEFYISPSAAVARCQVLSSQQTFGFVSDSHVASRRPCRRWSARTSRRSSAPRSRWPITRAI
jgi:hypothetical protein